MRLGACLAFLWLACGCGDKAATPTAPAQAQLKLLPEAAHEQVRTLCGACHHYPPADCLPRHAWEEEVQRGFRFYKESRLALNPPPEASVVKYYQRRAPEALPELPLAATPTGPACRFERTGHRPPQFVGIPSAAHVSCVHLLDEPGVQILVSETLRGKLWLFRPQDAANPWRLLSDALDHPGPAAVVDLDHDGVKDLVVADLGSFFATDDKVGSVVWLRGTREGQFTKHVLATGLGRVADVQAHDFTGDGKMDLVVAEFGWQRVGAVLLMENQTTDSARPAFAMHVIDDRHGAIHVPITDLNGDGRPDFVALFSQEHEQVVAFLNVGNLKFKTEIIFDGPHPAFGSSGIQLVDFDRDGQVDVLYTNGDSLDLTLLRPYHGVRLLMNRGKFPFEDHHVGAMYGVHRALAADFSGTGRMDVVAVSFLPEPAYTKLRKEKELDAVTFFQQSGPFQFEPHVVAMQVCDHPTADVADVDGDGRPDLVVGHFSMLMARSGEPPPKPSHPWGTDLIAIWRNAGR